MLTDFFLVLLASPKKISEFLAFSLPEIEFLKDNSVLLKPHAKFIRKNHSSSFRPTDVKIVPLTCDPTLCPVRALKNYIQTTKIYLFFKKQTKTCEFMVKQISKTSLESKLKMLVGTSYF